MRGGTIIREARRRSGLTQHALARRIGTTQSVVARWEAGASSPSLETVLRAVRACGLDLALSLANADPDHDRLIADARARTPEDRIGHLRDLVAVAQRLRHAGRVA